MCKKITEMFGGDVKGKVGLLLIVISILIISVLCFKDSLLNNINWKLVLWVIGWAFLGIGISFYGSRERKEGEKNDLGYYLRNIVFICFVALYAVYGITNANNLALRDYVITSSVAFLVGMSGERLFGILINRLKNE